MSDYNNGGNRPPPRVKNALDNKKLNLYAPCPTAPGKTASLTWQLHNNNPSLIVWTNDPSETGKDKDFGKIKAALDGPVFFGFLNMLQEAHDAPGEYKGKIKNKAYTFFGGKRSDAPAEVSTIHVVKDADGVIFLSVTARERPIIKFVLSLSDFHEFIDGNTGQPMTAARASMLAAKSYINMFTPLMAVMMATNWVEPPAKQAPNGGGGGGYRGNGGGGGGGNSGGGGEDMPW